MWIKYIKNCGSLASIRFYRGWEGRRKEWKRESISFQAPYYISPHWSSFLTKKISYCSRRYTQESSTYYYPHEKYYGTGPTPELPGWDNNSSEGDHAIPVHLFPKHVAELHLDQVTNAWFMLNFPAIEVRKWGLISPQMRKARPSFFLLPFQPSFFNWVSITL